MLKNLVLTILSLFIFQCLQAQNFQVYLNQGIGAYQRSDFQNAIDNFKAAIAIASTGDQSDLAENWKEKAHQGFIVFMDKAKKEAEAARDKAKSAERKALRQAIVVEANSLAFQADVENDRTNFSKALELSYKAMMKTIAIDTFIPQVQKVYGDAVFNNYKNEIAAHKAPIIIMELSNDESMILTVGRDKAVKVWNLMGQLLLDLSFPHFISCASFSSDDQQLLITFTNGLAELYDLQGQLIHEYKGHLEGIIGGSFAEDNTSILTWSRDNTAHLWNETGTLAIYKHKGNIYDAQFSPDERTVLTRSFDGTAKLWDLKGTLLADLNQHTSFLHQVHFSNDGKKIITISADKTVKVWDLHGNILVNLTHPVSVQDAIFSKDGSKILTVATDSILRVWSHKGVLIHQLEHKAPLIESFFSNNQQSILSCANNRVAYLWDINNSSRFSFDQHLAPIKSARFTNNEQAILTSAKDNTAKLWNTKGQMLISIKHQGVTLPLLTKDNKLLISSTDGKQLCIIPHPNVIIKSMEY